MRSDLDWLLDVKEAIERICRYAARGRGEFENDELIQTWILHHLQIIGEACRSISQPFKDAHPGIPWAEIVGQRHVLVHHYFGVDLDIVWDVVERDLPDLQVKIGAILERPEEPG